MTVTAFGWTAQSASSSSPSWPSRPSWPSLSTSSPLSWCNFNHKFCARHHCPFQILCWCQMMLHTAQKPIGRSIQVIGERRNKSFTPPPLSLHCFKWFHQGSRLASPFVFLNDGGKVSHNQSFFLIEILRFSNWQLIDVGGCSAIRSRR